MKSGIPLIAVFGIQRFYQDMVPIYSRCSDALLSWLLKNSVLHPVRYEDPAPVLDVAG